MTLTINDTTMTSDQTDHVARQTGGSQRGWRCPGCPARSWTATAPSRRWSWPISPDPTFTKGISSGPPSRAGPPSSACPEPTRSPARPSHPLQPPASPDHLGGNPTGRPPIDQPRPAPRPPRAASVFDTNHVGGCQRRSRPRLPATRGRPAPGPAPVRTPDQRRHRRRRRTERPGRSPHRPTARNMAGSPAAALSLRPGPSPLRGNRNGHPGTEDPAAHPRPLRHLR